MSTLARILLLPAGLLAKLFECSVSGSRDIYNDFRFRKSTIDRNCSIDRKTTIAENCHILESALIVHSAIGRFSYVGRRSVVQHTRIGSFCSIANEVCLGLGAHPTELFSTSPLFYRTRNTFNRKIIDEDYDFQEYQPIEVGHDVWVGTRAIVLGGVRIGDGAIVAANAVVTKDVPPYAIVAGVPAKIVRYRFAPEKIARLRDTQWWSWPLAQIRQQMHDLNNP